MSKQSKNKIICGFHVFKYALWQKTENWKCRESTESLLNKKHPFLTVIITRKLLKSHFVT